MISFEDFKEAFQPDRIEPPITDDQYEHARDYLKGAIEAVYKTGDVFMLESCLDELCGVLDVEIDPGSPLLDKRR